MVTKFRWHTDYLPPERVDSFFFLFNKIFGHPLDPALYRWKYAENKGVQVGVWHETAFVGHFGGVFRQASYFGDTIEVMQGCDVMVDPAERGILTRKGPLFLATEKALSENVGTDKRSLLVYGFPNARKSKIDAKHGLSETVGEIATLTWRKAHVSIIDRIGYRLVEIDRLSNIATEKISALWQIMRSDFSDSILIERTSKYIFFRYEDHPCFKYRYFALFNHLNQVIGLCILRMNGNEAMLMDVICSKKNIKKTIALTAAKIHKEGTEKLTSWWPIEKLHIAPNSYELTRQDIFVPGSIIGNHVDPSLLRGKWWLSMGDAEFF